MNKSIITLYEGKIDRGKPILLKTSAPPHISGKVLSEWRAKNEAAITDAIIKNKLPKDFPI